jgi:hypothetical protein
VRPSGVPRTARDYADAIPLGPVADPHNMLDGAEVNIQRVEVRGPHVVATMQWEKYSHPVCHALLPEEILLWGGDLPIDEATLEHWVQEAVVNFACAAALPLMSSHRTWNGDSIELTEAEAIDRRYVGGYLRGTARPEQWREITQYADPRVPPPTVEQWKADGSLISWHYVTLEHNRVLPVYGHGAVRWVADGVASFDYLELSPGLPETFGLMTIADAVHRAAAEGAHTITSSLEVPGLELLGFRDGTSSLKIDNRFLDIDYDGLMSFVSRTSSWAPPVYVQKDIERTSRATYHAG